MVIGGDGTILRAAELTHGTSHPAARRQPRARRLPRGGRERGRREDDRADRRAAVLQRGAAHPRRRRSSATRSSSRRTWALNEASVEKAARQRMLEVVVEVDGRPLSRFGCDGVVCATPTGSTAYNFSAGWPGRVARCRGAADGADQRARAVRAADGGGADLGAGRRGAGPDRGCRRALVRRAANRRPAAGCPDRGTPRALAGPAGPPPRGARSPTGWWPSSACPSKAGAARSSDGGATATGDGAP